MGLESRESSMSGWALVVDVSFASIAETAFLATKDEYRRQCLSAIPRPIRPEGPKRSGRSVIFAEKARSSMSPISRRPAITVTTHRALGKRHRIWRDLQASRRRRRDRPGQVAWLARIWSGHALMAIEWNELEQVPQNWNPDAHLPDAGWKEPRGAGLPHQGDAKVLKVTDADLAWSWSRKSTCQSSTLSSVPPRVFYKNLDDALSHLLQATSAKTCGGQLRNLEGAEVVLRD